MTTETKRKELYVRMYDRMLLKSITAITWRQALAAAGGGNTDGSIRSMIDSPQLGPSA